MREQSSLYKKILIAFLWIAFLLLVSAILGNLSKSEVDSWYYTLERSKLTPPSITFAIVWPILYILIALSGFFLWSTPSTQNLLGAKIGYIAQLVFNWSWTPLFFLYHQIGYALFCLILTLLTTLFVVACAWNRQRVSAALLIPYVVWLIFALYLNAYIYINTSQIG